MASLADMIKKAKEEVGTSSPKPKDEEQNDGGIQIERQNVEHIRGQAKSGI